jgi:hypothetical protein
MNENSILLIDNFKKIKNKIPQKIREISMNYEGWIVAGSAKYLIGLEEKTKDWDILIPWNRWGEASRIIPQGTVANHMGGFKFKYNKEEIDLWPGDIGWFLGNSLNFGKENYAVNLCYGLILEGINF